MSMVNSVPVEMAVLEVRIRTCPGPGAGIPVDWTSTVLTSVKTTWWFIGLHPSVLNRESGTGYRETATENDTCCHPADWPVAQYRPCSLTVSTHATRFSHSVSAGTSSPETMM